MNSTTNGLTPADIDLFRAAYQPAPVETGSSETGDVYAVAIVDHDEDGFPITRHLCRYRGTVALLDEKGAVLAEGGSVEKVLVA